MQVRSWRSRTHYHHRPRTHFLHWTLFNTTLLSFNACSVPLRRSFITGPSLLLNTSTTPCIHSIPSTPSIFFRIYRPVISILAMFSLRSLLIPMSLPSAHHRVVAGQMGHRGPLPTDRSRVQSGGGILPRPSPGSPSFLPEAKLYHRSSFPALNAYLSFLEMTPSQHHII